MSENKLNYGKYPVGLEPDAIKNMSEIDLFFFLRGLYELRPKQYQLTINNTVSETEKVLNLFNYFAAQTRRFGVENSEDFRKWINYYNNHFDNLYINPYAWHEFQKARLADDDIIYFLPEKDWRNSDLAIKRIAKRTGLIDISPNEYPDFLNSEKTKNLSEVDIFFIISDLRLAINKFLDKGTGDIKTADILMNIMDFYIYQTKRFGVEISAPKQREHLAFYDNKTFYSSNDCNQFYSWYMFLGDHFFVNFLAHFSPEQKRQFDKLRKTGGDLTPFLPKESWKEFLKQEKRTSGNEELFKI